MKAPVIARTNAGGRIATSLSGMTAIAVFVAAPLWAAKPVEQTRSAAADASIEIECLSGTLEIEAWDRNEVEVRGTIGDDAELLVSGSNDEIEIEIDLPGRRSGRGMDVDANLDIRVPAGARLEVETLSASITVSGVRGAHELDTMSGNVQVTADGAPVEIETVSGRIEVTGAGGSVDVETVNGGVEISGTATDVSVESVSGDVRVETSAIERGDFESVSGALDLRFGLAPKARLSVESYSGNVTLTLPSDVAGSFRVESFSGRIDNDFGAEAERTSEHGPGRQLAFTTGSDGARAAIETFSGNVSLERGK